MGNYRNFDNFSSILQPINQTKGEIVYVPYDAMYEAGENDEISIIAIGFNTNEPIYG